MVFKNEFGNTSPSGPETSYVAPRTPLEEMLAQTWKELLGIERIGVHDNFFTLGIDSLRLTRMALRLRNLLQVDLPVRSLFESATIASVAKQIEALRAEGQASSTTSHLLPIPVIRKRHAPLLLSFAQQRIWFLEQLKSERSASVIATTLSLTGQLHIEALERSLNDIIRRHESLRTTFMMQDGQPVQIVASELTISLHIIDLWHLPEEERDIEAQQFITSEVEQPFNLAHGPLLRTTLLKTGDDHYILLVMMHQIITDEWSFKIFLRELAAFYTLHTTDAERANLAENVPEMPVHYADFARWQRKRLKGSILNPHIAYWKEQLAGAPALLPLPTDHPRPAIQTMRGATLRQLLPTPLVATFRDLSKREGTTFFTIMLTAFGVLISRFTNQYDIPIGIPIANRIHHDIEHSIGFFVNMLVLRLHLSDDLSFRELLARVREVVLAAYAHQNAPFEQVVEIVRPERSLSYQPLFQVMFTESDISLDNVSLPSLWIERMEVDSGTARFDLTLTLERLGQVVVGAWEYATDLFDAPTIKRMMESFEQLLYHIADNCDAPLSALPILADARDASHRDHHQFHATAAPAPQKAVQRDDTDGAVAPRNPIEEVIANVWLDVLGVEQVGVHHNFFDLGGNSLLATQLVARLQATFQMSVPLRSLFERPTIAGLAERLVQREKVAGQVEQIAQLSQKIKGMSSEEINTMLREKKQTHEAE